MIIRPMVNPFITRVTLKNYKSIDSCRVDLGNLMFLVGPNAAGKSSFLDAIRFVADALTNSLDHALRDRGSIKEVRRRSNGHPTHFAIRLDFQVPNGPQGHYSFKVGAKTNEGFEVQDEECRILHPQDLWIEHFFRVRSGEVVASSVSAPASLPDRLSLVNFAGNSIFRPVFDALSRVEIYNLNPQQIGRPQKTDPSEQLRRDGSNAASVLRHIRIDDRKRINEYLQRIVPGVKDVETRLLGSYETMEFGQIVNGAKHAWSFPASSMSDGTLRSLGILIATLQRPDSGPLLLGLEEPETAVHPAAARTLMQSLRFASERRQVLVTSHSPELLDDPDLDQGSLLSVQNLNGITSIGPVDRASREVLMKSLFTPGELLRQNQLSIDKATLDWRPSEVQLGLFDVADGVK